MTIGKVKEKCRKDLMRTNVPLVLWDYAIERGVLILNATAKDNFKLQGLTAYEKTFTVRTLL